MAGLYGGKNRNGPATELLDNLVISTSGYGRCIPVVYGRVRVCANLVFYDDFTAINETATTRSGKGGGGSRQTDNNYYYTAAMILAICEGPVHIGSVWVDKDFYEAAEDISGLPDPEEMYEYLNSPEYLRDRERHSNKWLTNKTTGLIIPPLPLHIAEGHEAQTPWPYLTSKHPDKAIGYGSTAYVAQPRFDLGESGTTKNHSFEITGFGAGANQVWDANPAEVIFDMLADPVHGMGFPGSAIDSLADYRKYTSAAGLLVSACFDDQRPGLEALKTLLACTNSISVWSGGKLKIIPLGDLPIGDWQPNSTPLYALTVDDFLGQDDPIQVKRKTAADAYNSVKIKFKNRLLAYAEDVAAADDLATQDLFGVRPASEFNADCIATAEPAQILAQIMLQRYIGVRNKYQFKLGWRYTLLEPGDLVTLTEPGLGLNNTPVRIISVEEDEEGELSITAEDWPIGIATAIAYPVPIRGGDSPNTADEPGNCNPPVIFEPPADLSNGELQAWIGTSGGINWGGCEIWGSRDNATYSLLGRINGPARHGTLTRSLASFNGLNPDNGNVLGVNLQISKGELVSASQLDADHWETLCYVDGEIISFQNAVLAGANGYNLTSLRRGLFGSPSANHSTGAIFMRLDDAVAQIDFDRWDIAEGGETIYLKFPSFNKFGQAVQELDEVNAVPFMLHGISQRKLAAPTHCTINVMYSEPME